MPIHDYRDLIAWQKSVELTQRVYELVKPFPPSERCGLASQMTRAAVSIASNVAEGNAFRHRAIHSPPGSRPRFAVRARQADRDCGPPNVDRRFGCRPCTCRNHINQPYAAPARGSLPPPSPIPQAAFGRRFPQAALRAAASLAQVSLHDAAIRIDPPIPQKRPVPPRVLDPLRVALRYEYSGRGAGFGNQLAERVADE